MLPGFDGFKMVRTHFIGHETFFNMEQDQIVQDVVPDVDENLLVINLIG